MDLSSLSMKMQEVEIDDRSMQLVHECRVRRWLPPI
jgi:hypothetical protein